MAIRDHFDALIILTAENAPATKQNVTLRVLAQTYPFTREAQSYFNSGTAVNPTAAYTFKSGRYLNAAIGY